MKVDKSTQTCKEYNESNRASIDAGIIEAWEPTDAVIRQEAAAKVRASSQEQFAQYCAQFWRLVIAQLSTEDAEVYSGAKHGTELQHNDKEKKHFYVSTRAGVQHDGSPFKTYGKEKIRISVGEYGDKRIRKVIIAYKPNEIAKLATDVDFAKKIAEQITKRMVVNREKFDANCARDAYSQRVKKVYEANKEFFNSIRNYGEFRLADDGTITTEIEVSGTIERLKEIVALAKSVEAAVE